ncbi:hypothetical protein [Methanofollis ethanolicus]|uniref:hypothetical protein n=1 Tax=Methanofollis ethanolicus TaxID=488124 RepID=UPI00128F2773|nr:hypothetical protein [Methanofollis ethanolicus]
MKEMTWYSYGAQIKEEIHRGKKYGPAFTRGGEMAAEAAGPVRVEIIVHGTGGAAGKRGRLWRW